MSKAQFCPKAAASCRLFLCVLPPGYSCYANTAVPALPDKGSQHEIPPSPSRQGDPDWGSAEAAAVALLLLLLLLFSLQRYYVSFLKNLGNKERGHNEGKMKVNCHP